MGTSGIVWSGALALPNGDSVDDIQLTSVSDGTSSAYPRISPETLQYLSHVILAAVPLYLAIGPNLALSVNSQEAKRWFLKNLLEDATAGEASKDRGVTYPETNDNAWAGPDGSRLESRVGILVRVPRMKQRNENEEESYVTEILFYASRAVAWSAQHSAGSSNGSSALQDRNHIQELSSRQLSEEFQIYALPMSSHLLYKPSYDTLLHDYGYWNQDLGSNEDVIDAQFLPQQAGIQALAEAARKKMKLSDIFDNASALRKTVKRTGKNLQLMTALTNSSQPTSSHSPFAPPHGAPAGGHIARVSQSQLHRRDENLRQSFTSSLDPPREASPLVDGQVQDHQSTLDDAKQLAQSQAHQEGAVASQNKQTISRVVMAGMRLYGLQQRRLASRNLSRAQDLDQPLQDPSFENISCDTKEHEFKVVYHQTYRATAFAFRQSIDTSILQTEAIRDMVDRLLMLFCNEPT